MLPQRPLGCVCRPYIITIPSAGPADQHTRTLTISPRVLVLKAQTSRQTTWRNMHEIAHTDYFRAWTCTKVVDHRACERGNRIRAVVGWGRDLRRTPNAPSLTETERQREAEMKKRILSSFISVPPTALYLTLDLDESCYGVTWTWGCRETETDRGREGDKGVKLHTAEAQCGQSSYRQADRQWGQRFKGPTGQQADRLAGQPNTWQWLCCQIYLSDGSLN